MNYYSHHIGDFNNATRHLTRVEQSVYRDAIELYYSTECVLTSDFEKLARRLICVSDEEKTALLDVLNEFFNETDNGWSHDRCDEEIAKYRANTSNKAKAGIASALSKKNKSTQFNSCSTDVQLTNNQEPITNNQEPHTKARVCVAIKRIYDAANKSITDMNPDNPTLIALIEAGATVGEFTYAAQRCVDAGKGFGYLLGVVKKQREDALKLKIHKGVLPATTSREAGRNIAAQSIFTIENTRHLQGVKSNLLENENEIKSIAN